METFKAKFIQKFMSKDEFHHFQESYDQAKSRRQLVTEDDEMLVQHFIDGHVKIKDIQRIKKYKTKGGAAEFVARTVEVINKRRDYEAGHKSKNS